MRQLATQFICTLLAVTLSGAMARHVQAAEPPFEINAILELTGGGAFLGSEETETLHAIERLVNKTGGIRGRALKFVISDDQTNPQTAVQLVNALVAKNVPAIIGLSLSVTCSAVVPIVAQKGPLTMCYTPAFTPPPGSFVFGANGPISDTFYVALRYMSERKWNRVAFVSATDATGQATEAAFNIALTKPEFKNLKAVAREHFNVTDMSVSAQVANIKAANPQVIFAAPSGTPFGTLLHGLHDAGIDIPILTNYSNTSIEQMNQYKQILPTTLCAAGLLGMVTDGVGKGPIRDAQTLYQRTFAEAGIRPSAGADTAWDATLLLVKAFRKLGADATAGQLRSYFSGLHGWAGINGLYDFRSGTQRGIGQNGVLAICWNPDRKSFLAASRPGGALK